ncbi:MAG: hypothetical protein E7260_09900 [Lachnospiraceae bacterium]|nr:hypothetical protein [Lachnospiraceae bacterium]
MEHKTTYTEFLGLCAELAKQTYPKKLRTEICSTVKNNDVELTGLLLKEPGEVLAPNFFLKEQYKLWCMGQCSLEEIVNGVLNAYTEEMEKNRKIAEGIVLEWERMKPHVYIRLVGRGRNEKKLDDIPHEEYLDMVMIYHYVIEMSEDTRGALLLTNEHLLLLGITKEELHEAAVANTQTGMQPVILDMEEMLCRLGKRLGVFVPGVERNPYLYVMSNAYGKYGAVSLLFQEELERFSGEIGNSFFILPSSVHELILVPDSGGVSAEQLLAMVREVNRTQIEATEVLTDSVYYYDREIHTVRRIA